MSSWRRRRQGEIHDQEVYKMRSENRKPTQEIWQITVPAWEKKFCSSVGSVPWQKLMETKKYMYLYDNVVKWNDSAGEEAFKNAKSRFWAEMNGLPCNISLPDPELYIDNIDWNSNVDPELLLDLEREPKLSDDNNQDEKVVIFTDPLLLSAYQSFPCTGWGEAEEDFQQGTDKPQNPGVEDKKNLWEHSCDSRNGAVGDKGWGYSWNEWDNSLKGNGVYREHQPRWGKISSKKDGSGCYDSRYKAPRYPSYEYQTDRGHRGRRMRTNVAYEKHALRQWNFSHDGSGEGGNPWSWEKPVL